MIGKITTKRLKERETINVSDSELMSYLRPQYYNAGIYGWNYHARIYNNRYYIDGYRTPKTTYTLSRMQAKEVILYIKSIINDYEYSTDIAFKALEYIDNLLNINN